MILLKVDRDLCLKIEIEIRNLIYRILEQSVDPVKCIEYLEDEIFKIIEASKLLAKEDAHDKKTP